MMLSFVGFAEEREPYDPERGVVRIDRHPDYGEYRVRGRTSAQHSYHNDKEDAEGTARALYGKDVRIVHRSHRYGPE